MTSEMNKENRSSKERVMISDSPECSQPCFSRSVPFKKTRRRLPKNKDFSSNTEIFTAESMSPMSPICVTDNIPDHDHPEKYCVEEDEDFVGRPVIGSDSDEDEVIFPEEGLQTIPGYVSLGAPTAKCNKCNAIMWKEERVNKNVKRGTPEFSLCCAKGQISLPKAPPTPSYMMQLLNDPKKEKKFRRCIRMYNTMFAFTSMGDGYHDDIPYVQTKENRGKKRKRVTMKEFYSYKFQVRHDEGNTPRLGGRLFQQGYKEKILFWNMCRNYVCS
ncbi:hypothetical protein POM88_039674 [Heracleum sosnowskyi]|uniref:Uncharacterized protein n=1 Tax=Heracleum sosnowskyi TaxID=360622 RepID=A0AAD8M9K0_9APIA|nr:hypothetical protein POM88_039674 [Heracleum sosnowskyi]